MSYSVAIRTLGTSQALETEIESLHEQTILPERIIVYIAEGYERPSFQVGFEKYVWVRKGMIAQRALLYDEIDSDYILLLDDDVELAPDSLERMLNAMKEHEADCVGADTFKNQDMSLLSKIYAGLTNFVFPHWSKKWAFMIHLNGSFSYNNHPHGGFYLSQSCAGPCSLWRKDTFLKTKLQDELWLENKGMWFGEDVLLFYKLYVNGGKLGILYDSGVKNLDGKTASGVYQKNIRKFYVRSFASFTIWHRTILLVQNNWINQLLCAFSFSIKAIWLLLVNIGAGLYLRNIRIPYYYVSGLIDGIRYVHSDEYRKLPSFIVNREQ